MVKLSPQSTLRFVPHLRRQGGGTHPGRQLHVLHATNEREIDAAFATLARLPAGALEIGNDVFFNTARPHLPDHAARPSRHCVLTLLGPAFAEMTPESGRSTESVPVHRNLL
jgi:hypothetical protein